MAESLELAESEIELKTVLANICERLGYSTLRPEQTEAVSAFAGGKDVFVALPTGSGKSLCFAIPPWVFDVLHRQSKGRSIVIVVSPLLALMKNQVGS